MKSFLSWFAASPAPMVVCVTAREDRSKFPKGTVFVVSAPPVRKIKVYNPALRDSGGF